MITEMKKKNKNNGKDTSDGAQYIPINLRIQKQQYKAEIETYMADISNLTSKIRDYQKRVEDTPRKEQELLIVERDYNNLKNTYNELLSRKVSNHRSCRAAAKAHISKYESAVFINVGSWTEYRTRVNLLAGVS